MYSNMIENIYGSEKRLDWIKSIVNKSQSILELGCGTGLMITIPLLQDGYNIVGIDNHEGSIEYGRGLLKKEGQDINKLKCGNLADLNGQYDVIMSKCQYMFDEARCPCGPIAAARCGCDRSWGLRIFKIRAEQSAMHSRRTPDCLGV